MKVSCNVYENNHGKFSINYSIRYTHENYLLAGMADSGSLGVCVSPAVEVCWGMLCCILVMPFVVFYKRICTKELLYISLEQWCLTASAPFPQLFVPLFFKSPPVSHARVEMSYVD